MKLKINGNDIMELTGLEPGRKVGEIKKELEELILDNPELNNRDYLLEYVKQEMYRL